MQPNNLRGYVESDARVERMRKANRYKAVQGELAVQEEEEALEHQHKRKIKTAQREEAMAEYLHKEKHDFVKEDKMLQLVRENDPELRALAAKIRGAQTMKERGIQMVENKAVKERVVAEDRLYAQQIAEEVVKQDEAERLKNIAKQGNIRDVQDVQREQMLFREQQRKEVERQAQQERIDVDAIVSKVQEQDYMVALSKINKQKMEKMQHEDFVTKRESLRQEEDLRKKAEEVAISEYLEEQNKRRESDKKFKMEKEAIKTRILEEQSRKIIAERAKEEELEALINEYYVELRAQKDREDEAAEWAKKQKNKEMLIAASEEQMRNKQLLKDQEAIKEQEFRQELLDKWANEARMDQMSREKQLRMKADHAAKVQEIIEEKRQLREEDAERHRLLLAQQKERDEEWRRLVAIERRRMLEDNAELLCENLPKGLTEDDVKIIENVRCSGRSPAVRASATARRF